LQVDKTPAVPGAALLTVRNLAVRDQAGVMRVKGVSFDLRAGEIVGVAGVAGNGQSELLEALAGICTPDAGQIIFGETDLVAGRFDPRARRRLGLAHIPEDRLRAGVVADFDAQSNVILGYQDRPGYNRGLLTNPPAILADCERKMTTYDVRPPLPGLRIASFSGGNQQKLVIARELDCAPQVLLVGQPTRGVDIGAIEFIHRQLVALRDAGKALLLVSVELEEILGLADRILVMAGGEIVGELTRAEATEERIGLLMAGVRETAV
jgi:ABC-type uncharacterized transport system ATPase subunit